MCSLLTNPIEEKQETKARRKKEKNKISIFVHEAQMNRREMKWEKKQTELEQVIYVFYPLFCPIQSPCTWFPVWFAYEAVVSKPVTNAHGMPLVLPTRDKWEKKTVETKSHTPRVINDLCLCERALTSSMTADSTHTHSQNPNWIY